MSLDNDVKPGHVANLFLITHVGPAETALVELFSVPAEPEQTEAQVGAVATVDRRVQGFRGSGHQG